MNILGTSSYVSSLTSTQSVQTSQVDAKSSSDADTGEVKHAHRGHGGGHMRQALTDALQSLGLTVPGADGSSASTQTGSDNCSGDSSSGGDASGSQADTIKQDMQQFMHSLFEAVKGEASSSSTGSGTGDPRSSFADGLSSLISQVSGGTAPADLQSAFSKLTTDLQQNSGGSSTTSDLSSSASSSGQASSDAASQAMLQALLTNLQQSLGYGSSSNLASSAVGNAISTLA